MLRRSYLKSVLGAIVTTTLAPRLFESANAAQPPGARPAVPATVTEALKSGSSSAAAAFALEHGDAAAAATIADKSALLRLVAKDQAECAAARTDREKAALRLLEPSAGNAADLAAIIRGFGGPQRVQAIVPNIQSKELKAILTQALAATR
jgi:hypothetical protein